LPNFRACTKARAVGEARSRAVFAQDDTRGDLSSFSCYNIVGACIARPWTLSADLSVGAEMVFPIFVGTDVLGGPQNTIIRNAINRQMRIRSIFVRLLVYHGPSVLRSKTHAGPYKIGENLHLHLTILRFNLWLCAFSPTRHTSGAPSPREPWRRSHL